MVPADSPRIPRVRGYSGSCWASFGFAHGGITLYAAYFHLPVLASFLPYRSPTTPPGPKTSRFGLFPVRSPLLRESLLFSLPAATKMFQFAAFAHPIGVTDLQSAGLPHSEISGSRVICTSPELFAAYRVLLRLREPRHPPVALSYFFYSSYPYLIPQGTRPVVF